MLLSAENHFPKVSASNSTFIRVVKNGNPRDHPRQSGGGHGGHGGQYKK